jgi:hypothetical protein
MNKKPYISILLAFILWNQSSGQGNTVGTIVNEDDAYDGYTLFSPSGNKSTYLIDNEGRIINQWDSKYYPGMTAYLQEDGSLLRAGIVQNTFIPGGGGGGSIIKYSWSGEVIWEHTISDEFKRSHHDLEVLPNGNILILVWEVIPLEDVLMNGRNPDILFDGKLHPESIIEIEPSGSNSVNIVWEWHAWDHLVQDFDETKLNYGVVSDNPEKIDLNYINADRAGADWQHANSISYNEQLDQIMISLLLFNEIWIIDHNTTTHEAKGRRGDLLFRWGNPRAHGAGTADDQELFAQHDAKWISSGLPDAGKIMIFNNGKGRRGEKYSSVLKIEPIISGGEYQKDESNTSLIKRPYYEWADQEPTDFYASFVSGAQQLPNGHMLICNGETGTLLEVNDNEEEVWRYINPVTLRKIVAQGQSTVGSFGFSQNHLFGATKYGKDFPAFNDKVLTPGDFIELEPLSVDWVEPPSAQVHPNPTHDLLNIYCQNMDNRIQLWSLSGQLVYDQHFYSRDIQLSMDQLPNGVYLLLVNQEVAKKIKLVH